MRTDWTLLTLAILGVALVAPPGMAQVTVAEWTFDQAGDFLGWEPNNHTDGGRVEGGALRIAAIDWDPFLVQSNVAFDATPWQALVVRMASSVEGRVEMFYTNTLEGQYAGFSPGKSAQFSVIGDGQTRDYVVYPFWHAEGRIIKLRLDLPGEGEFAIESIRVEDAAGGQAAVSTPRWDGERVKASLRPDPAPGPFAVWAPPLEGVKAEDYPIAAVRMSTTSGRAGTLSFASSSANGFHDVAFRLIADGKPHTYNVEMTSASEWRGEILALRLRPSDDPEGEAEIESLALTDDYEGPADLAVSSFLLEDVVNIAGEESTLVLRLENMGGDLAKGVSATLELPAGVETVGPSPQPVDVEYGSPARIEWQIRAAQPTEGTARVTLRLGASELAAETDLSFRERLGEPSDVVPAPVPVETDYRVGVYYFPGWWARSRWQPIESFPERKPVLGWYDEALPEIADWQIKWAVEHGVSFFVVDWYWSQGNRSLEHWLHDAYFKSRYRDQLDFCLLWANHNAPGSSSHEDCLAVTRYWLDNYFHLPEYVKVNGQPVMVIFTPHRLREDMGSEGVRKAFDAMDEMCRAEGFPGLYMVACTGSSPSEIQRLAEEGYDAVSGYNYPGLGAGDSRRVPYADLLKPYADLWEEAEAAGVLPEIPVLSGGWDSRPWHGDGALARYGRTPALFERHCEDAKAFLDRRDRGADLNMCIVEAWNEWGEGSYIGPHREFGFGYLDAIRNVFTDAPAEHVDLTPKDVGLGPYDLAPITPMSGWSFAGGDAQGWGSVMDMTAAKVENGQLVATSTGRDPAFFGPDTRVRASRYPTLVIRMRTSVADEAQLFWATTSGPTTEGRSLRFATIGDGQVHEYRLDMSAEVAWRGIVTSLRLDPGSQAGVEVGIESIELVM